MKNLSDVVSGSQEGGKAEQDAYLKTYLGVDVVALRESAKAKSSESAAESESSASSFGNYSGPKPALGGGYSVSNSGAPDRYDETGTLLNNNDDDDDNDSSFDKEPAEAPEGSASGDQAKEPANLTPAEGMKTKRVDAKKYEGEHNKAGWREEDWKGRVKSEDTRITTKLYSKEEQEANRLVQMRDGSFKRGDNQATGKVGFAMDETGRMVAFDDGKSDKITLEPDPDDEDETEEIRRETKDHPLDVVKNPGARAEVHHHSSVLGGETVYDQAGKPVRDDEGRRMMRSKPAALAGFVEFNEAGQIGSITNQSGHYKPTVDYLLQGVEYLMKQGAFFEDKVVRMTDNVPEGEKYKPLREDDPDYKLYLEVQKKLPEIKKLVAEVTSQAKAIGEAKDDEEAAKIWVQLKKLTGELDTLKTFLDQSQKELRQKGVGPSNRLRGDASAEFLDVKPGMTGADIRAAQTTTMHVGEFLKTGGGYENKKLRVDDEDETKGQASLKEAALNDLKANLAPRRFAPKGSPEEQEARREAAQKTFRGEKGYEEFQKAKLEKSKGEKGDGNK